ncbi:glycosyltransferase family 39 protein [Candidatus Woesearchaeota archaeon]|nr:glycosyltransferase family 39 protein [Candidatus Woesearchaeota archaeon]
MKKEYSIIFLMVLFAVFIAIEIPGLVHLEPGDENVYFYMGKLISEGKMPYRDFFSSHPSLHIFSVGLIYSLFGYNLVALKIIPLLCYLVSAVFLFLLMKKRFGSNEAIVAVFIFLFSYNVMLEATYFLGIELTTMFCSIGLYFLFEKRFFVSGIFFGFAGLSGLYSLIPSAVVFAVLFLKQKRNFLFFLFGFSVTFVLVNLLMLVLFGQPYVQQSYIYHLKKPTTPTSNIETFVKVIINNWLIFLGAILFILFSKKRNILQLPLIVSAVYLLYLAVSSRIFNFYFIILFLFLSTVSALGFFSFFSSLKKASLRIFFFLAIIVLFGIFAFNRITYIEKIDFDSFANGKELASFIEQNSPKDAIIFGDSDTAALISLLSGRRLAFDMADTNDMVFSSGLVSISATYEALKNSKASLFIILRPGRAIFNFPETISFIQEECILARQIDDPLRGTFLLLECSPTQ